MVIIKYNPTSPGRRHGNKIVNKDIYKGPPYSKLVKKINKSGGRNNLGRITTRHIGRGHKKRYRLIDFKRIKDNIPAKVKNIEYDPNRTANIALIIYKDGEKKYIIAPKGLKHNNEVISGISCPIKLGNTMHIGNIPIGTHVHNIEIKPKKGGQLARSAGSYAQIVSKDGSYVAIKLRSGEIRRVLNCCRATIGEVSNAENMLRSLGKAGVKRWLGIRPTVRGTAMNPIDHPHGGGEGRNFGKHPVSPKGIQTKGKKTRINKRTDKFIIRRRNT